MTIHNQANELSIERPKLSVLERVFFPNARKKERALTEALDLLDQRMRQMDEEHDFINRRVTELLELRAYAAMNKPDQIRGNRHFGLR